MTRGARKLFINKSILDNSHCFTGSLFTVQHFLGIGFLGFVYSHFNFNHLQPFPPFPQLWRGVEAAECACSWRNALRLKVPPAKMWWGGTPWSLGMKIQPTRKKHLRLIAVFGSTSVFWIFWLNLNHRKYRRTKKINKINKRPTETSKTAKTPQGAAMSGSVFFMACFEALEMTTFLRWSGWASLLAGGEHLRGFWVSARCMLPSFVSLGFTKSWVGQVALRSPINRHALDLAVSLDD